MISIFIKEINSFLNSLIGYIVMGVFLVLCGLLFWVFPNFSLLDYGYANMDSFFELSPFVFLFLIPAITMRSFSEEQKEGTLDWLFTKPISNSAIILGKFLACWTLVCITLLPTLIYPYSLYQLGNPIGNIDLASITGSYLGLILLGGVYVAIGIFCSSLSKNQIIAFLSAVFFCFFFYFGFQAISGIYTWSHLSLAFEKMGLSYHYYALSKGVLDIKDLFYFFTLMLSFLLFTSLKLSSKKW